MFAHFNVVYAGNIGIMQNVDLLVKTAKLMQDEKNICFHIVGDGAYKEKLQSQATSQPREAKRWKNLREAKSQGRYSLTTPFRVLEREKGENRNRGSV